MVLQNVAQRARLLVEGAAPLNTDGLCHRDLHVVDVAAVPDRLKDKVAEAEDQDVAHRLFPKVVVDAVNLRLAEDFANFPVQLDGRLEVAAERLLNDDTSPAAIGCFVIKTCGAKAPHDLWERRGRRREVVEAIPVGAGLCVNGVELRRK